MKAWHHSAVSERLGLRHPIIQGPFGSGLSAVDLVVAVSDAGGLGSFGVHHLGANAIAEVAAAIRARTARPFALNLWCPLDDSEYRVHDTARYETWRQPLLSYYAELGLQPPQQPERFLPAFCDQLEAVLDVRPAAFSFVFGIPPTAVLARCRELEIATIGTATTPEEAHALAAAGVDMIVATGFEAGGHRVSFQRPPEECLTGTLALVPQVVDAVDVPVIAAGGIADGRGIVAAMALGAQAVQIGTAFLACRESNAAALHRDLLFSPAARHTGLTRAFSGRLARGVVNRLMQELEACDDALAPYPVQSWLTTAMRSAALARGDGELVALWAGQAAPLLRHREAARLFDALVDGVEALIG